LIPRPRAALAVSLLLLAGSCRRDDVEVRYDRDNSYAFSSEERRAIADIASQAAAEVRRHLPALAGRLTVRIRTGSDVIAETGETGTVAAPDLVVWTIDPNRPEGALAIIRTQLRGSLFHELHHLVRDTALASPSLMDRVVTEGLATAFERDYAGVRVPWGDYGPEVNGWVDELLRLPPDTPPGAWLYSHPDGRRWIGLKAGTYLADRARERSGCSASALVSATTAEVLRLAGWPASSPGS
jgi:hypothetical protein